MAAYISSVHLVVPELFCNRKSDKSLLASQNNKKPTTYRNDPNSFDITLYSQ